VPACQLAKKSADSKLGVQGFNEAVKGGPGKVAEWYEKSGKHMILKSTGEIASKGGRVVTGMARFIKVGEKVMKGAPVIAGLITVGTSIANGQDIKGVSNDLLMDMMNCRCCTVGGRRESNHSSRQTHYRE